MNPNGALLLIPVVEANDVVPHFFTPTLVCILATEMAERFAYYGFRCVLVLYFVHGLGYSESQAIAVYAYVIAFAYMTPLLGACVADGTAWGKFTTIVVFGSVYYIGLTLLAVSAFYESQFCTMISLCLICIGTGGIKPCVSSFGADQVESERNVRAFFNSFYFCINVGAVASVAIIPLIKSRFGFGAAFLLPSFFMLGALLLFLSKRKEYRRVKSSTSLLRTFRITYYLLLQKLCAISWISKYCSRFRPLTVPTMMRRLPTSDKGSDDDLESTVIAEDVAESTEVQDAAQALNVLPILALFPIYWSLYDQQGSVWTLQASRMHLPWGLQPEQLNLVNPIQIMIFLPLFERCIYPLLETYNVNTSPLRRMMWGMVWTAMAFIVSGWVETAIETQSSVNVFWQLPQITFLAVGEILLSVTGLEFAYAASPTNLKSFVTALFLCTTAVGDGFSGLLYSTVFESMDRASIMYSCAGLMMVNLALLVYVSRWYEQHRERDVTAGTGHVELQHQG